MRCSSPFEYNGPTTNGKDCLLFALAIDIEGLARVPASTTKQAIGRVQYALIAVSWRRQSALFPFIAILTSIREIGDHIHVAPSKETTLVLCTRNRDLVCGKLGSANKNKARANSAAQALHCVIGAIISCCVAQRVWTTEEVGTVVSDLRKAKKTVCAKCYLTGANDYCRQTNIS